MRGNVNIVNIVNSPDDLAVSQMTREQVINMATITVRTDKSVYPDGYDQTLKAGDAGFIEPDYAYEEVIDQGTLDRFGVTI